MEILLLSRQFKSQLQSRSPVTTSIEFAHFSILTKEKTKAKSNFITESWEYPPYTLSLHLFHKTSTTMSFLGMGRPQPTSEQKIAAVEGEMRMMADTYNR